MLPYNCYLTHFTYHTTYYLIIAILYSWNNTCILGNLILNIIVIEYLISFTFYLILVNPIPYRGGGVFHPPPQTDIANYGVLCLENMLFYYLTFHITGLPNFWRKKNLKFLGGTPPSGPLKI